jgi:hypothetical protein
MQHRLTDLGHDRTQFIPPRSQCARVGIAERRPQLEHDLRDAPLPAPTFRSAIAISNHSHPHSSHHPSLPCQCKPGTLRRAASTHLERIVNSSLSPSSSTSFGMGNVRCRAFSAILQKRMLGKAVVSSSGRYGKNGDSRSLSASERPAMRSTNDETRSRVSSNWRGEWAAAAAGMEDAAEWGHQQATRCLVQCVCGQDKTTMCCCF